MWLIRKRKGGIRKAELLFLLVFAVLLGLGAKVAAAAPATVTEFDLPASDFYPGPIVQGSDGNLWLAVTRGQIGPPPQP